MGAELSPSGLDPRILCPTTGEICPAQQALVQEFERSARDGHNNTLDRTSFDYEDDDWNGEEYYPSDRSSDFAFLSDDRKFNLQLTEYAQRSKNCVGPQNDDCPTRIGMERSAARRVAVNIAKTLRLIRG
jgi:hypothetical protein